MNLNIVVLNLNIFVLYMSNFYECKRIYSNHTDEFISLAVISDYVYIGGKNSLIQLNSSMDIMNIKPMNGNIWLLTPYKLTDQETILIACEYKEKYISSCTGYRNNLSTIVGYDRKHIPIKSPHARYTTTTIGYNNILTIASSDCLRSTSPDDCFAISSYKDTIALFKENGNYIVKYLNAKKNNTFIFDFRTVVGHDKYTYFLFVFNNTVSKLGKFCNDTNMKTLNAYEDVPIFCSHNGVNFTKAQDLIFWNDDLLVVFTDGSASVICKFTNLFDHFEISRIDRLKCRFKQLENKYFNNPSLSVCYNETKNKCQTPAGKDEDCPEMTNGFCSPKYFPSIEGDVPMTGDVIYYSQNSDVGDIVNMKDAIIVDQFVILYVGTRKGFVGKIFINDTDAFSLGDFKIVEWLSPVIDIKRDGENMYAMTKHVIANVADNADCGTSSNCEDCMKSENPICGWDIIRQSCNKHFDLPFWVPSAGRKCLTIKSTGIAVDENDSISREAAISFELIPSIYLSDLKYVIKINSSAETRPKGVKKEKDNYKTENVNVSYGDTVMLSVTDINGAKVASTQVMLYKCRTATNCTSCVQNKECSWCALTLECYHQNSDGCNGQINAKAILNFTPDRSIIAGGRKIRITGQNMFSGSNCHTYDIKFCTDNNDICIKCRDGKPVGETSIMCRMDKSNETTLTKLIVIVDKDTPLIFSGNFSFVENPTIIPQSSQNATVFRSGGIKITIKGTDFLDVGEVHVHNVENPCTISSDIIVVCETPPYVSSDFERRNRSTGQNISIKYDDYQTLYTIYYIENPIFDKLPLIEYDKESTIHIKGRNLLEGAKKEDYFVQIGLDGRCVVKKMTNENITCLPPKEVPRTNHSDDNIVFIMVKVGRIREIIGNLKYVSEIPVMTIVIAVLATAFVAAVVIGVAAVLVIRQRKIKAEEHFEMELISREEKIRDASREEFADAQMTICDIKTDLVTSSVPYVDYQSYAFHQLFPNQEMETHPLLHEPMIANDRRIRSQKAMTMFDKLMTNKLFLKSLVQTLEHQDNLIMKDKANFASILSVAVLGNMRLFYELVSCLLSDMIHSAPKKQHKVLFRRLESITQRLMVNWLEMSLYDHLKDGNGLQLFMLYKATQTVIEKAPVDAITGNSRNTLAEETLLKTRAGYETMTLNIDLNGNSYEKIPVSVLDCDTITQVKQKCITAIYKNKPASEVPTPHELELEWHHGKSGRLTLQDIDNISDRSNGMLRLNILKHYMVKDGNVMALMYKEDDDDPNEKQNIQNTLLLNPGHIKLQIPEEQEMHIWHLSNLTDEEKSSKEHEIGELFLNRLFQTKLILRDYIDAAFEGMMDAVSLSVPVRYFLCMLDKQGKDIGVDNDVLQTWKSECYGTRVWASLISKPQILFDVDVPSHVEPCMDILRQVFIDSFTLGTQHISKESSTQKLLFHKDVAEYRKRVKTFFLKVEMVNDKEFWEAMDDMSTVQTREMRFNRQATLHQLISFISRYEEEIIEDFAENDEIKNLEFGKQLEEIINLMES